MYNLKEALQISGMNSPLYDARRRAGWLGFMDSYSAGHSGKSRNKYGVEHVTALALFNAFVTQGVSGCDTDCILSGQFFDLSKAVTDPEIMGRDGADCYCIGFIFGPDKEKRFVNGPLSACVNDYNQYPSGCGFYVMMVSVIARDFEIRARVFRTANAL